MTSARPVAGPLGAGLRLDEREHPLADRLLAQGVEHRGARAAPVLHVLRDLAQRELTESREVVLAEEVEERPLRLPAGIDLARAQPVLERLRREVDEDDLVRLVEDAVRERLAHAHAVSSNTASFRLSRCWTLTVEMTSMPASRISSMSW